MNRTHHSKISLVNSIDCIINKWIFNQQNMHEHLSTKFIALFQDLQNKNLRIVLKNARNRYKINDLSMILPKFEKSVINHFSERNIIFRKKKLKINIKKL